MTTHCLELFQEGLLPERVSRDLCYKMDVYVEPAAETQPNTTATGQDTDREWERRGKIGLERLLVAWFRRVLWLTHPKCRQQAARLKTTLSPCVRSSRYANEVVVPPVQL